MSWISYALLSALAASATAIFAKLGVENVPSNLATALRTIVVLVLVWLLVWRTGELSSLPLVSRRSLVFLSLSGIATGVSWLAYFKALQMAPASSVAPIDKLSFVLTVFLAYALLGETVSWKVGLGAALMGVGALITLL